jgi:hypothetical protein
MLFAPTKRGKKTERVRSIIWSLLDQIIWHLEQVKFFRLVYSFSISTFSSLGKHACPGRFFAVNELKLLLSHTILHYDMKFDEKDEKPKVNMFGARINLDAKTQVMFRRRAM